MVGLVRQAVLAQAQALGFDDGRGREHHAGLSAPPGHRKPITPRRQPSLRPGANYAAASPHRHSRFHRA
jgi:hypothetical protein